MGLELRRQAEAGWGSGSQQRSRVVYVCMALVAQWVKNLPAKQEMQVRSLDLEDPLEEVMATHFSIVAWEIHGQRSLVVYSPWDHKRARWS